MAKKVEIEEKEIDAPWSVSGVEPYELPEGWKWCKWGNIGNFISGNGFKEKFQGFTDYDIPFYKVGSLKFSDSSGILFDRTNTINNEILKELKASLITENSIIFAKIGEAIRLNRRSINSEKCCIDNNLMAFLPEKCYYKYAFYWSKSIDLYKYTNATTVPAIRKSDLEEIPFPLPPTLTEQQRIVNRIESMFTKLDEAKEKAQNVVDSFETRKAAILHQAFTGNLTAKWRKENGVKSEEIKTMLSKLFLIRDKMIEKKEIQRPKIKENFDTNFVNNLFSEWKVMKLGSIAFVTKLAGFEYTKYIKLEETGDIPAIRAQNVRKGYLDESNLLYISKETSEFLQRSALTKKSVLVTFIGAGIGDVCVFDKDRRYHLAPNVAKVEPFNSDKDEYIDVNYILYYLLSHFGQHEIFKDMKATAQPSLSMETIRDITIPIPTTGEQKEIVRILDTVLEKERTAKFAAEQVLEQIDLLKKSILARAFRGEL